MNTNEHKFLPEDPDKGEVLVYQADDGRVKLEVRLENETVWLKQAHLCKLFQKSKSTISEHIKNIFKEGELEKNSVVRKFRTTAQDGKTYDTQFYNLDVIIFVWNPITGCSKISPGCKNRYAERMAKRLKAMGKGIALEFKRKYPEMYRRYRELCEAHRTVQISVNHEPLNCYDNNLVDQ